MREIKFRAWDTTDKIMKFFDFYNIHCWHFPLHWRDSTGLACELDDKGRYPNELMQYTGLKDKSGKEIWEGDILGIMNPTKTGMCWEVTWYDFGWQILLHNFDTPAPYYVRAGKHWADHEVIGNIYENPELLRKV